MNVSGIKLLFTVLFIFKCLYCALCQDDDAIPNLADLDTFHTRVTWMVNDESMVDPVRRYVEEYFDKKRGRGRLNILDDENSDQASVLWYQDLKQLIYVRGYDCNVFNVDNKEGDDPTDLLGDYGYNGFTDTNESTTIVGPSVYWRLVVQNRQNATKLKDEQIVRGIPTNVWIINIDNKRYTLYLTESKWKTFENSKLNIPVRLTILEKEPSTKTQTLDFYVFETYSPGWTEFSLPKGVGCKGKKTPDTIKMVTPSWDTFYTQWEMTDLLAEDVEPATTKVFYDMKRKIVRYDFDMFGTNVVVHDLARDITYAITEEGTCTKNDIALADDGNFASFHKAKSLVNVFEMDGDLYYAGKTDVRGILCDVWEKVVENATFVQQTYDKLVFTFYLNTKDVTMQDENSDTPVPVPIQIIRSGYNKENDVLKLTLKQEENYFNFQPLYVGTTFSEYFNIRNCDRSPENEKYFVLSGQAEQTLTDFPTRYRVRIARQIQKALAEQLSEKLEISMLRLPYINVDISDTNVTAELIIKEKPPAFDSFTVTSLLEQPKLQEIFKATTTPQDCATFALKQKDVTGFKMCKDNGCRVMTTKTQDSKPQSGDPCTVYNLKDITSDASDLYNEPSIAEASKSMLDANVLASLNIFITARGRNISVTMKYSTVGESPLEQFKDRELYTLIKPYRAFKLSETVQEVDANTFGECYLACSNAENIDCQSFSYCLVDESPLCRLSPSVTYVGMDEKKLESLTLDARNCSTYSMAYLHRFTQEPGVYEQFSKDGSLTRNQEECAKLCATGKSCVSFQFCEHNQCILSNSTLVDLNLVKSSVKSTKCVVYSQRRLEEFVLTGSDLVTDGVFGNTAANDVETCAKQCFDDAQRDFGSQCTSFNYCPKSNIQATASCQFSTASALDPKVKTTRNPICRNYERKAFTAKIPAKNSKSNKSSDVDSGKGMSGGLFYGLMISMFFVGLLGTLLAFMAYVAIQNRRDPGNTGFGLSVRFIRQRDEQ